VPTPTHDVIRTALKLHTDGEAGQPSPAAKSSR
jgi:hypothetical protein